MSNQTKRQPMVKKCMESMKRLMSFGDGQYGMPLLMVYKTKHYVISRDMFPNNARKLGKTLHILQSGYPIRPL